MFAAWFVFAAWSDHVAPFLVLGLLVAGLAVGGGQFFGMGRATRIPLFA